MPETTREQVLEMVLPFRYPQRGISTNEIAGKLGVKRKAVTKLLGELETEGMVDGRRVSGVYRYVRGWKL